MYFIFQLIKDMVSVSEATDWSMRSGTQSKYKALRCTIDRVADSDGLYKGVKNQALTSLMAVSRDWYVIAKVGKEAKILNQYNLVPFLHKTKRISWEPGKGTKEGDCTDTISEDWNDKSIMCGPPHSTK